MHTLVTVIAIVIVVVGVYFSKRNSGDTSDQAENGQEVLSQEVIQEEESSESKEVTPSDVPNTPTNTSTPTIEQSAINDYRYPNSSVISSSNNSLILNSADDSDKITDWYKEKINSEGMNVRTFVKTKANDKVLNKLVGADGKREVRVEISKASGEGLVRISVDIISS